MLQLQELENLKAVPQGLLATLWRGPVQPRYFPISLWLPLIRSCLAEEAVVGALDRGMTEWSGFSLCTPGFPSPPSPSHFWISPGLG